MSKAPVNDKALLKAVHLLREQLAAHRTPRLRLSVDFGIARHTYEFRLVSIKAGFVLKASGPGGKAAAPEGRKPKKGNKQ